jgi:hypothetical protein
MNFFLENKFLREKKNIVSEKSNGVFLNYNKIKSVLLLFNIKNDENLGLYEHLANLLKNDKKKVSLCCFVEQKKSHLHSEVDKLIIKKEDISFWKKPKSDLLDTVSAQNFDAVFLLSTKKSLPVLYVLMHTQAKIKCGSIFDNDLLDLIIDASNMKFADETYIFDNIIRYLKMINQNKIY